VVVGMTSRALVTGHGPAADAAAEALSACGWEVSRGDDLAISPALLVTVPPVPGAVASADRAALLAQAVLAPMALAEALAKMQPPPDAAENAMASAQVIHLIDRAALVPGCADPAHAAVSAALAALVADGALRLAPALRVNGLALPLAAPGALLEPLRWLTGAAAVSGRILPLGEAPRPQTEWRAG
jgi:hypothetical protein